MPLRLLPRARRSPPSKHIYNRLDDYQVEACDLALDVKTAAILMEQGTGKTWVCGAIIEALADWLFTGLLVVSLQNLESTWVKFIREHLPQVKLCRTWDEFRDTAGRRLLLIHYEALPAIIARVRKHAFSFIGFDEAHRLKNRSSLSSRTAAKLRSCAEYKLIMTGTPIDENPADLWAQFRFLNPDVFGERWADFADEYLTPIDADLEERLGEARPGSMRWRMLMRQMNIAQGKREFDFDKIDQFNDAIEPWCIRIPKSVLKLPPMNVHRAEVVLRGEQRRLYDTLARDMITDVGDGTLTAPMRAVQLVKLHRICGGYVSDDSGEVHEVGRAKLRRLLTIMRRVRRPVVVFCRYLEEIAEIRSWLEATRGVRIETLTGRTKKRDRAALIADFQAGDIDVLVAQIKTGGVGIDLFRSSVAIFFSYWHSRIDYEQALARLHRRGQTRPVDVYLIVAVGTVDEDIHETILRKRRVTGKVLVELERRRQKHGKERQGQEQGR